MKAESAELMRLFGLVFVLTACGCSEGDDSVPSESAVPSPSVESDLPDFSAHAEQVTSPPVESVGPPPVAGVGPPPIDPKAPVAEQEPKPVETEPTSPEELYPADKVPVADRKIDGNWILVRGKMTRRAEDYEENKRLYLGTGDEDSVAVSGIDNYDSLQCRDLIFPADLLGQWQIDSHALERMVDRRSKYNEAEITGEVINVQTSDLSDEKVYINLSL